MTFKTSPAYQIGHLIDVYNNFCESTHPEDVKQCIAMARQIAALSAHLTHEATKRRDSIIAALRSSNYEQTTGELYDSDINCYCALGVLCDLVNVPKQELESGYYFNFDGFKDYLNCEHLVPPSITAMVGITNQIEIMRLNDTKRLSFNEIADWIEANL